MNLFDNKSTEDLIDALVWHNCAGHCPCKECIEIKDTLNRRKNGVENGTDSSRIQPR
jgi:hypothetical protein